MYQKRGKTSNFKSRPSRSNQRSGGSKYGNKKPGNSGNRNRNRRSSVKLDISKFINKALAEEKPEIFVPKHKFNDFEIDEKLKQAIASRGYETPTPIQDETIPKILIGNDLVGIANTGTGKTGAFLIPLINKVLLNKKEKVLVVVPTRELAIQIEEELHLFTKDLGIRSVVCVGGMNIGPQISKLRNYHNFIIGTPGRLKDLIARKRINLAEFHNVVLDEADRMLDMGFVNDMRYVMSLMPKSRQTLFFSATMSSEVENLIGEFLQSPISVSVKYSDTSKNVDQDVVHIERNQDKIDILHDLLISEDFKKVLIFGRTKRGVERLSNDLIKRGFKVDSIHGDKNHGGRQRALRSFKDNTIVVLVATDVAARGLDIPDVSHVINFDLPESHDDYAHRIGRTGRGDKKGKALTFIEKPKGFQRGSERGSDGKSQRRFSGNSSNKNRSNNQSKRFSKDSPRRHDKR